MDTKDTAETTAPSVAAAKLGLEPKPAREPYPGDLVPSVSLSGPKDDSLDLSGLGAASSGLRIAPPKGKEKEKEKETRSGGAREDREGEHERTDDEPFGEQPAESTFDATEHLDRGPTFPSTTTTFPTTHPATSSPTTTPLVAEGIGLTWMPYFTYGVDPLATAPSMAHLVSQPVALGSSYTGIREPTTCYDPDLFRGVATASPLSTKPAYAMPEHGFTSLSDLRGPESCGGRSKESGTSFDRSVTRSKIKKALRGAGADLVGDLTQKIRAKLEPLIPPQGSPITVGASPHRVQANYPVAGLTHTLGGVRSRPMPAPAAIPRSSFVPRTAQPPYSHVGNSKGLRWTSVAPSDREER